MYHHTIDKELQYMLEAYEDDTLIEENEVFIYLTDKIPDYFGLNFQIISIITIFRSYE